ncbi:tyrosine-type recombinase/integrase [Vannielia litorea]|uniref:tyrosine-type recombinase/integrase n=1 Tax=Vannielia litorea TaxID=1217970 RepID=UPI001C98465F|nr:integrase arm-type DNA-binding domain-containing protein [Vannielia litorea]MBY6047865.1 tyrosine-type recombinase/integrase [Vannielia litorea]MBY6075279.1 tyrosine-type recombinase/integrase [Vannielia litorea]
MLTDTKARKLSPSGRALAVGGVPGLYLRPGKSVGTGKFQLRFVSPFTGKRRDMGLGTYPATGLSKARKLAMAARELIASGIDPINRRAEEQTLASAQREIPTFEKAAVTLYEEIAPGFKNTKHRAQWITTLRTYVFPAIGKLKVDGLTPADFATGLRPIWLSKPETASRVAQRCDRVMLWCLAHGYTSTNPVAALPALLPKPPSKRDRVRHHPSVPWRSMPQVCEDLFHKTETSVGRMALLFTILTAARSEEVREATWSEINLETATWSLPAERMKARQPHRVPLSRQALGILRARAEFSGQQGYIFSYRAGRPLSGMTLLKVLRDHKVASDTPGRIATTHGFRSSFRDWASENGYARDLAERALAHTVSNATEAAYHRTDLLEQRREMMESWADWVFGERTKP